MKKKVLYPILALVLALSLALPMAALVSASPATMTVVSNNTSVLITGVYNKAGGGSSFVDLSSSPLNAVGAWEPDLYSDTYPVEPPEATDSTWDDGVNWFEDNVSAADWIWETHLAEGPASYGGADPLYDADAARYGRVVLFETTFNIPGNPLSATLRIAADNGYEAWVNTGTHYRSATAAAGWETSNLHEAWLSTSGWQSYGTFVISGSELVNGSNTLYVLAGNEYFWSDDGDSPIPPTVGTWGTGGYHQYNPGAAIFQLDVEYEERPSIEVEKDYRYTNVCFEKDNDLDGLFSEDPVEEEIDNDGDGFFSEDPVNGVDDDGDLSIDEDPSEQIDNDDDGLFGEDPVDCLGGTYLGDPLPMDGDDYVLEAVIHPKNNKVKSYNPGQYYAVSTVNVTDDVEVLTIMEDWSDCCNISALNPKKGGGSVVIVQVGPGDTVAYQILDATSDAIAVNATACTATATLEDVAAGTIIYMYVKFGPALKGQPWAGPYGPCVNYNRASVVEEPTVPEDWIEASANLTLVRKD